MLHPVLLILLHSHYRVAARFGNKKAQHVPIPTQAAAVCSSFIWLSISCTFHLLVRRMKSVKSRKSAEV